MTKINQPLPEYLRPKEVVMKTHETEALTALESELTSRKDDRPNLYIPRSVQKPPSKMEIQLNNRALRIDSICSTDVEATQLIGALTAMLPFLPKGTE
jgi:hypothetical protein